MNDKIHTGHPSSELWWVAVHLALSPHVYCSHMYADCGTEADPLEDRFAYRLRQRLSCPDLMGGGLMVEFSFGMLHIHAQIHLPLLIAITGMGDVAEHAERLKI